MADRSLHRHSNYVEEGSVATPEPSQSAIVDSTAHERAGDRLLAASGSVYEAFDNLACGFDHEQVLDYLRGTPTFQTLSENDRWKVAGMVMGFAMVAVESDRALRRRGRRWTTP